MKAKFRGLTLVAVVVVMVVLGCGKESPLTPKDTQGLAPSDSVLTLLFATPKSIAEVSQLSREHGLDVLELRVYKPEYISGFRLEGRDLETSAQLFLQEHRKFLTLITSRDDEGMKRLHDAAKMELESMDLETFRIHAIKVQGTMNMANSLPGTVIEDSQNHIAPIQPPSIPEKEIPAPSPSSLNHPNQMWAPYGGTSEVNKSYSYQRFIFNNVSQFWPGDATYEHETHIWDKNYANQTGYWSSSMPNAYLDCGNFDSVDNFAVGTFTANQLRPYSWYFAYIGLSGQSSPISTVTIFGQRGRRQYWSCWWVFGLESAGPFVRHTTGSGISWQF